MKMLFLFWTVIALSVGALPTHVGAQPPKDIVLRIPPDAELRATLGSHTAKVKVRPPSPEIVAIVPTTDQKFVEEGVSQNPYPFTGRSTIGWSRYRNLLIVGRNLPRGRQNVHLTALDAPVTYEHLADPSALPRDLSGNPDAVHLRRGFEAYHGEPLPPEGLDWILVRATLNPGVLPGDVPVVLNDKAYGQWLLEFGDTTGQIAILRDGLRGELDASPFALVGENVVISVVSDFALPVDEIPVRLAVLPQGAARARGGLLLIARRVPGRTRTWRTSKVFIGSGQPTSLAAPAGSTLLATVDENGLIDLRPPVAQVNVVATPATQGATWREALLEAATCAPAAVRKLAETPQTPLPTLARQPLPEWRTRGLDMDLGDHAAMLLLRETFLKQMQRARADYASIAADARLTIGFRRLLAKQPRRGAGPLLDLKVTTPKGRSLTLADAINPDLLVLLEQIQKPLAETLATALAQKGLQQYLTKMDEAMARASEIDKCDIVGLMNLTGPDFGAVREVLIPRLMVLQEETRWVPDPIARSHVLGVETIYEANKGRKEFIRQAIITAVAVVLPVLGPVLGPAAVLKLAFAEALVYATAVKIPEWAQNRADIEFAAGEHAVLGPDRLARLKQESPDWVEITSTLLGVGISGTAVSHVSRAAALQRAAAVGDSIKRGQRLASRFVAEGPRNMNAAQKHDLFNYLGTVRSKKMEPGAVLTPSEKAALDTIDDLAAGRQVRPTGRPITDRPAQRYDRRRLEELLKADEAAERARHATERLGPADLPSANPTGRLSPADETARLPPVRTEPVSTDRFADPNPRMLRRLEVKAHGGLSTNRPGAAGELMNIERARSQLSLLSPEKRTIAVEVAEAAERLGVQGDRALQHASMFGGRQGISKAELLAHTLMNKGSDRAVTFAEFFAEAGLKVAEARALLRRVAAENGITLRQDLTIPGLPAAR